MRLRDNRAVTTLLAAAVVVGGLNMAAYAGSGHAFLLGKHNTEKHTSVLKNKHKGAALQLKTKRTSPPLKVNSTKRVVHLNADAVDGVSAGGLQTKTWLFPVPSADPVTDYGLSLDGLPAGYYQVGYSLATSPHTIGGVTCWLRAGPGPEQANAHASVSDSDPLDLSATAIIDLVHNAGLHLRCGGVSFALLGASSQIYATRIDTVVRGTSRRE